MKTVIDLSVPKSWQELADKELWKPCFFCLLIIDTYCRTFAPWEVKKHMQWN